MTSIERYNVVSRIDFDFSEKGDEWISRFSEALREIDGKYNYNGLHYSSSDPLLRLNLSKNNKELDSHLLITHNNRPVEFRLTGPAQLDDELVSVLSRAVELASVRLGGKKRTYEWSAVLLQIPKAVTSIPERLAEETKVGDLQLEPLDLIFKDPVASPAMASTLGSTWRVEQSIPIRVRGSADGYAWNEDAAAVAARKLRSLCGLLSLCWHQTYEVAEAAAPLSSGPRQGRDRRPWFINPVDDLGNTPQWEDHHVPPWLNDAWKALQENKYLSHAVDAFLEGRYISEKHPSLAAVAYTSSVEAVASRLYKLERCSTCRSPKNIALSFRSAIREVLPEPLALELDPLYGSRSRTVHDGKLHGGEITPGLLSLGIFPGDATEEFRRQKLNTLKRAAKALIVRALLGDLPSQRELVMNNG